MSNSPLVLFEYDCLQHSEFDMLTSIVTFALVAATTVFAAPGLSNVTLAASGNSTIRYNRCDNSISPESIAAIEAQFQAEEAASAQSGIGDFIGDLLDLLFGTTIPVYFHVVAKDKTPQGGWLSDKQIRQQIDVMNQAYARTGLKFKLESIDKTVEPQWHVDACPGTGTEATMKRTLRKRKGDKKAFNVYTVRCESKSAPNLLGYSTFPWNWDSTLDSAINDGSVIHSDSLPGGNLWGYDLGYTLVHEFGHWAGLYHTFQGDDCDLGNDFVADTPQEAGVAFGCPVGLNSCPDKPGVDSIHNYMAWTDDSCMHEFTRGQIKRMASQLKYWRGIKVIVPFW
ncbi:metalloprotease [Cristinia sonorae]|uniref:Metalloprotease n=1 Tax=Cristinia sonorae TaxID=1940300 RepID=A0A8K0XR63_9AGAR|nr:metalloprotease [Cristinia sonorae]